MAQARHIEQSAAFGAKRSKPSLRERVPMSPRAIQQAPFRVLVGANMPAVLVEMGFLTNPAQEKQLQSDEFQNRSCRRWSTSIAAIPRRAQRRADAGERVDASAAWRSVPLVVLVVVALGVVMARRARAAKSRRARTARPLAGAAVPHQPGRERKIKATLYLRLRGRLTLTGVQRDVPFAEAIAEQARAHRRGAARAGAPPRCVSAIPPARRCATLFITERGDAFVDLAATCARKHPGGVARRAASRSTRSSTR